MCRLLSQKPIKVAIYCAVDVADVEIIANGNSHISISDLQEAIRDLRFFSAEAFRCLLKTMGVLVCD